MKILLATTNKNKAKELREILKFSNHEIVTLSDLGRENLDAPEDKETFKWNAMQKAEFYFKHFNLPVICDDSGLIVESLGDFPGVRTKRWMEESSYLEKTKELIRMSNENNPAVYYECSIDFYDGIEHHSFEGKSFGRLEVTDYTHGFAFDNYFREKTNNRLYVDMTTEEKNKISHRGKALRDLSKYLENIK